MPLIISHGQGKSASSFLFQVASSAARRANGAKSMFSFAKETFPESSMIADFAAEPTDEIIDAIERHLPEGKYYVIKTHGTLTPTIVSRIKDGTLLVHTSFRDPRDRAIAMFDAGAKDRAAGKDRIFAKLTDLPATFEFVKDGWERVREWLNCDGVLKIPYYLTATDQDLAIQLVCDQMGLGSFADEVNEEFAAREKIREFNQGIVDRFLDVMTPADLIMSSNYFKEEIEELDRLTERWMTEFGCRDVYDDLHARREKRIQEILASAPA